MRDAANRLRNGPAEWACRTRCGSTWRGDGLLARCDVRYRWAGQLPVRQLFTGCRDQRDVHERYVTDRWVPPRNMRVVTFETKTTREVKWISIDEVKSIATQVFNYF